MKKLSIYLSLLFILTCSKDTTEDTSSVYIAPPSNTTNTPSTTVTQYTITVSAGEGGSVSTAGGTYNDGTSISITATPNEGYGFIGWNGSDSSSSTISVTLTANTTIEALFGQVPQFTLPEIPSKMFTKGVGDTLSIGFSHAGGYKTTSLSAEYGNVSVISEPNEGDTEGNIVIEYTVNTVENVDIIKTIAGNDDITINITGDDNLTNSSLYQVRTQPEPIYKDYLKPSYDLQFNSLYKIDFQKVRILNNKANEIGFGNNLNYMANSLWVDYTEGLDQDSHTAVAVLDLNQDGYEDFIVAPTFSGPSAEFSSIKVDYEVYMYESGEFIYKSNDIFTNQIPKSYLARKALVGDFDGDGDGDAYFAHTGMDLAPYPRERESSVLLINDLDNNGKIKVVEIDEFASSHEASSADIDNDGDLDIFSASLVDPSGRFSGFHHGLLLNDGNGNFQRSNNILYENTYEAYSQINTSEISDLDNDGYYDIFYGGSASIGILQNKIYGFPRVLWGEQDYIYKTTSQTLLPNVQGFDNIVDVDFYDLDMDGTKEVIILRTGDNLDDDGNLINAGDEFINTLIGESYYYGGYYIQIVKLNDRSPIDVTSDFISDNFYRTSNNVWSEGDYNSDWIKWLIVKDYDNNGLIDIFTPLIYSVGPGDKNFKRWEWNGSKFIKVE